MLKKFIFNTSMPRAGSELLQVLLHQNPSIYASTTSPLLEYQFAARGNYDLPEVRSGDPVLMQKAFINMCAGMAQSYYQVVTDKPIISDKNRGWSHYWEWVDQWNPDPKMICMVRDLRSIIASMEQIYRKNRHRPVGPDNPAQLQNMTVAQRAQHWLNTQPIGLALARTADLFQRDIANKILFVRYEDLCEFPDSTMKRIYNYIDEDYFQHDFKNIIKTVQEDDSVFGPYGSHKTQKELKKATTDWKEILPKEVGLGIRQGNLWYFEEFNY